MAYEVNEEYEHSGGFTLVDEDIYRVNIFEVAKKDKADPNSPGGQRRWYEVTLRIDGGDFDGEDVKERYVGLQGKSLFRLYDILKALGELEKYYDAEQKRWHHIPAPEDLEGKALYVKIEHEEFQAKEKDTQKPQFNDNGTPRMLNSAKPTSYYPVGEPKPEFKRSLRTPAAPPAGPSAGSGVDAVLAAGGTEVGGGGTQPAW